MDETETTVTDSTTDTTVTEVVDTPVVETTVDADQAALAAFDQGIAEVVEPKAEAVPTTAADVAAAAAAEAAKTNDTTAAAPVASAGAPLTVDHAKKDDAAKPADAAKAEVIPDPETDAAVTELGLKGKAEQRFREMAGTIKTLSQEVEPLRAAADRGEQWEKMVLETKATPEQFGQSLGYLAYINSGDPAKMGQAFDFLLGELQVLGKNIGREVPGLVDPIQDHPDLAQAVTFGEMTRAAALELAQRRVAEQRSQEHTRVTTEQGLKKVEWDNGIKALSDLSEKLKAEDPAFMDKVKVLAPLLDRVRQTVAPSLWAETVEDIYKRIELPAPVATAPVAPARPPVGAMPLRATGTTVPMQRSLKGADEMDAFNLGLESVSR
jgi:hypothetical protein